MNVRTNFLIPIFRWVAVAAYIMLLGGCGDSPPEERLEAAGERLSDTESELSALNIRIEDAESELDRLQEDRRALKDKVLTLEERVQAQATDVAVFRSVQSVLLQEESLLNTAISVAVDDGTVSLSGVVNTEAQAQLATRVASALAGVKNVVSRIRVRPVDDSTRRQ